MRASLPLLAAGGAGERDGVATEEVVRRIHGNHERCAAVCPAPLPWHLAAVGNSIDSSLRIVWAQNANLRGVSRRSSRPTKKPPEGGLQQMDGR
jgi:hypothetical protein